MRRGTLTLLFFIILLVVGAAFVNFWPNSNNGKPGPYGITNPFTVSLGLDLKGGESIQLQPKAGQTPSASDMQTTQALLESRLGGGLGVKDATVRVQGGVAGAPYSILVELPQFSGNNQSAVQQLLKTGVLEFWNTGSTGLQAGAPFDPSAYTQYNPGGKALFTGKDLDPNSLSPSQDSTTGKYDINFEMAGGKIADFGKFTTDNIGSYLTVTLDRTVVTSAVINSGITGQGQITGNFTSDQAQQTVNLLKYGSLPVALNIASQETIGGTLGQEAIDKAILAGIIGLAVVAIFMLIYYRVPGFLADIALIIYTLLTFAVYKLIGVTLSLAGIAGFILSIGMAVDANVLIFERVKEELRAGRILSSAIDIGWKRAWPSIRDSNTSTIITCAILYAFGSNFGATIIVGFASTLFLGVVISMFTAVVVTRTLLNLLVPTGFINHPALFGLPADAIPGSPAALARRNATV